MNLAKKWLILTFTFLSLIFLARGVPRVVEGKTAQEILEEISKLEAEVQRLKSQGNTLKNQIAQFNAQINLTSLKIEETEEKISLLGGRIDQLEGSLSALSSAFSSRVSETYKMKRLEDPLVFLITSQNLSQFVTRFHYLNRIIKADKDLLVRLQQAQDTYEGEKDDQEDLQSKLEEQKQVLGAQKVAKDELLRITKNDEVKYKALLDQARRELEALASSEFTGKKEVKKGDVIGLMGNTGFSTGPHLHFGFYNLTENEFNSDFGGGTGWYPTKHFDPRSTLQNRSPISYDPSCSTPLGSGSFPWPLGDPYITQCYGVTPYSSVYNDNFHKGLDMATKSNTAITAVEDGIAYFYRGKTSFGNNVRIFHSDGRMSLYMHLQ